MSTDDKKKPTKQGPNLAAVPDDARPEDFLADDEEGATPNQKQLDVPGTKPKRNRKVENAAMKMRTAYIAWKAAQSEFTDAHGHCLMVMEQENVPSVRITDEEGDEVVFARDPGTPKVKMKKLTAKDEG